MPGETLRAEQRVPRHRSPKAPTETEGQPELLRDTSPPAESKEPRNTGVVDLPKVDRATANEPTRRVLAIGSAFAEQPVSSTDPRRVLALCLRDSHDEGAGVDRLWLIEPWPLETVEHESDVSGVLGLLSPWGAAKPDAQHGAFERAVADAQMWLIQEALRRASASSRSMLMLQGPLLPKLRGRLFYRFVDYTNTPLYVVTSDPRWRAQVLGALQDSSLLFDGREPRETARDAGGYVWAGPIPDGRLDRGGRVFIGWRNGESAIHVYVPSNTVAPERAAGFWRDRNTELESAFRHQPPSAGAVVLEPCSAHDDALLPATLTQAVSAAAALRDRACNQMQAAQRALDRIWRKLHGQAEGASQVDAFCAQIVKRRNGFDGVLRLAADDATSVMTAKGPVRTNARNDFVREGFNTFSELLGDPKFRTLLSDFAAANQGD